MRKKAHKRTKELRAQRIGSLGLDLPRFYLRCEVAKLRIEDKNGVDLTPEILSAEHVVLLFSYAPSSLTNEEKLSAVEKVKGHPLVYAVSTDLEAFKGLNNTKMDATAIKTIARSNPFVLVLNQGKIVQKKPITEFQP